MKWIKSGALQPILVAAALVSCAVAAWLVARYPWDPSYRLGIPFAFLGLVFILGLRYGRMVGILGSVISALVFAFALYQPVGSLAIADADARSTLAWAILLGVSASYLLLPPADDHRHHHR